MFEIGRLCLKLAGRDAGRECVIIKIIDDNYVLVDGNTRRKKVNMKHLEPLNIVLDVKEEAGTEEIISKFKENNIPVIKKLKKENE